MGASSGSEFEMKTPSRLLSKATTMGLVLPLAVVDDAGRLRDDLPVCERRRILAGHERRDRGVIDELRRIADVLAESQRGAGMGPENGMVPRRLIERTD